MRKGIVLFLIVTAIVMVAVLAYFHSGARITGAAAGVTDGLRLSKEVNFNSEQAHIQNEESNLLYNGLYVRLGGERYISDQIIVKFKPAKLTGISPSRSAHQVAQLKGVQSISEPLRGVYLLELRGKNLSSVLEELNSREDVEYAEPNYIRAATVIPNDPSLSSQWSLNQASDYDIDAPEAWDIEQGDPTVVIAILDTGVDLNHPDLASKIWSNSGETAGNGIDDDGNGYIDDVNGWDFINDDNSAQDDNGHGTHCAGISAAATDNSVGIAGVCWNCKIMPVKVLDSSGTGTDVEIANGIHYAVDNGADVISMSFGGGAPSTTLQDAIDYAYSHGVILVASAGNDADDSLEYPADYENVISVSSTDSNDEKSSFSQYGPWVDIAAPGSSIYSTYFDDTYATMSGTSMAAPHVAGLVGLLLSHAGWSQQQVRNILRSTTDPVVSSQYIGTGRINANAALQFGATSIADLDSSLDGKGVSGTVQVSGTASGDNFNDYTLSAAPGTYPLDASYSTIKQDTVPVSNGLLSSWSTTGTADGIYTLRLQVSDSLAPADVSKDYQIVDIQNANISSPVSDNHLYTSGNIAFTGTALADLFQSYKLEYGSGMTPTSWSDTGVVYNNNAAQKDNELLATIPVSALDPNNYIYTFKLSVTSTDYTNEDGKLLLVDTTHLAGWPKETVMEVDFSQKIADINSNGALEVIATSNVPGTNDVVYCLEADGTNCAGWPVSISDDAASTPALKDIDGDGNYEIFFGTSDCKVYCLEPDGTNCAGWPVSISSCSRFGASTPSIADIDSDGDYEIIVGAGDKKLHVFEEDGSEKSGFPVSLSGRVLTAPAVGDVNNDRQLEIAIGTSDLYGDDSGALYLIKSDGSVMSGWPKPFSSGLGFHDNTGPELADFDGDGDLEIVAGEEGGYNLYVYNYDGTVYSTNWPINLYQTGDSDGISSTPTIADLNGDGTPEIVISAGKYLHALRIDGTELGGFPTNLDYNSQSSPTVGDIDGDGTPEIVVGNYGPEGGTDASGGGRVYAVHNNAMWVMGFPKVMSKMARFSAPVIADLNRDSYTNIVIGSWDGHIYVWDLKKTITNPAYDSSNVEWGQFNFDLANSGVYRKTASMPIYFTFDGSTTDFALRGNLNHVKNAVLERAGYGKIDFGSQELDFENLNLDGFVTISNNQISIDTTSLPNLDVPATLTIEGLSLINPEPYKDGAPCEDCTEVSYSGGDFSFQVNGFSTYSAEEGCGDGVCDTGGESCSTCSTDCGACPESHTSTGGSGGGGGGGGSSSTTTSATKSVSLTSQKNVEPTAMIKKVSSTETSITATPGATGKISIKGKEHEITIKSITSDTVVLMIQSEPIEISLSVGETKEVDIDADGTADISVTLNSVSNNKADITVKDINLPEQSKPASANLMTPLIISLLVLLAVFLIMFFIRRRRKK